MGAGSVDAAVGDAGPLIHLHFTQTHHLEHLHSGELESLFICWRHRIPLLFTDDLAVRRAARGFEIRPVGSLGIVVRAHRLGALTMREAPHAIQQLQAVSSLFVTNAIVDQALLPLEQRTSSQA